jgi:hypothetical protein
MECSFQRTVSAGRKKTVESVDYWMSVTAISTHRVPTRQLPVINPANFLARWS